jgi:hypothetical protein
LLLSTIKKKEIYKMNADILKLVAKQEMMIACDSSYDIKTRCLMAKKFTNNPTTS